MKVYEESRSEQLHDLKEASRFLGACFQEAAMQGHIASGEGYLAEIKEIESKIKDLVIQRLGLMAMEDSDDTHMELLRYILKNKYIVNFDTAPAGSLGSDRLSQIVFFIQAPLDNCEEELARRYMTPKVDGLNLRSTGEKILYKKLIEAIFVQPTISFRVGDVFSFGGGLIYATGGVEFNRNLSTNPLYSNNGQPTDVNLNAKGISAWGYNAGIS